MIKVENEIIETEGDGMDLLSEASIALTEVTRRMSEGDPLAAAVFLSSMVSTSIIALATHGINIDMDTLLDFIENDQYDDENE
jgi:hypothetical protein